MSARTKNEPPTTETVTHIAAMLKAMGDPVRLKILYFLRQREHSVSELVEELGCSQANVSKHLSTLKTAGLVESRTDKQSRFYHVADPVVNSVCDSVCSSIERRFGKRAIKRT